MPRVNPYYKMNEAAKQPVKIDYFNATIKQTMKAKKLTNLDYAELYSCTRQNAGHLLNKPAEDYSIDQIINICDFLKIPLKTAFNAIEQTVISRR